jgi:hypothetical protein
MTVYAVCVAEVSFESERLICVLIAARRGLYCGYELRWAWLVELLKVLLLQKNSKANKWSCFLSAALIKVVFL